MATAGTATSALGWCVVHPDPPAIAPLRRAFQHPLDANSGIWPIPPGADREQRVADVDRIAIHGKRSAANRMKPVGGLLALAISRVEVMIAGTHQQATFLCNGIKTGR